MPVWMEILLNVMATPASSALPPSTSLRTKPTPVGRVLPVASISLPGPRRLPGKPPFVVAAALFRSDEARDETTVPFSGAPANPAERQRCRNRQLSGFALLLVQQRQDLKRDLAYWSSSIAETRRRPAGSEIFDVNPTCLQSVNGMLGVYVEGG